MPAPTETDKVRFFSKVSLPDENGCMRWTGATYRNGYGHFTRSRRYRVKMRDIGAHVFMFTITSGAPASGMDVCHTCDNEWCVAPLHLWEGTRKDNLQDMSHKGRGRKPLLTCVNGHEKRARRGSGRRWCPTCAKSWNRSEAK